MEFEGMPSCWTDYYVQGFKYVNEVMGRPAGESQINAAADILKSYNPRINYREEELTPEFIFQRCTETWDCRLDAGRCAKLFYSGLELKGRIYQDTLPALIQLKKAGYRTAALTDLPTAMPDEFFKKSVWEIFPYLDIYVSSQSCGRRKPDPKGIFDIAEYFSVPVTEICFVGDEDKDKETARRAGCRFIRIRRGEWGKDSGTGQTGAEVSTLQELLCLLEPVSQS